MSRRKFIKKTGAVVTATALSASIINAPAVHAKKRYRWKMVTAWPPNFPIFQEGAERFARDVSKITGGRLTIQVFAGGQLVPPLQTFDAVSQGTVQMGHGAAYYWAGKVPAAQFFTAVPFGMNAQGMNAWLYYGGGLELWREIYKKFNIIPFPMGNTGVQMGGWFNKRINTIADLKGLKMRIPGLGGKVMAKAGVNPVLIAGGEIYTAMERGTIDAVEWAGPFHDLRLGLYRTAKHYYYPGWHEPGPTLELSINRQAWKTLPTDLQLAVNTAAVAQNQSMLSEFEVKNLAALHQLQSKYHVKLEQFPDAVIKTLHQLTTTVLQEQAKKDKAFRKVLKAYSIFQNNNNAWNHISEAAYARARSL